MKIFIQLIAYSIAIGVFICIFKIYEKEKNKKPLIQTVQIIQNGDTTLYTGYVHETQYFVKIFDTCNIIQTQYRGNFKINYK